MDASSAVDKVRKLLALANSKNEHEAANAAARAAQIMERYRLSAAMLAQAEQREDEAEPFSTNSDIRAARAHIRMPTWYWQLAWSIAGANRCKPWTHDHPMTGKRRVTFLGRPSHARAAAYMLDAIANEVDRLGREYVAEIRPERRRSAGKSFRLGCIMTIDERLEESAESTEAEIRAELSKAGDESGLVRLDSAIAERAREVEDLERWAKSRGMGYKSRGAPGESLTSAFLAGREAGHDVRLSGGTSSIGTGAKALPKGSK